MDDSDQQLTQSGAMIGSNDDLLTEILLRLPAISIVRFKSVSKHLRRLLSDSHFTLRYDKLPKSPGLFAGNLYVPFDVENRSPPPFRRLEFYPDRYGIKVVQSCNGLLLCCSDCPNICERKYYVFNPTTKQFAIIPSVPGGPDVHNTIISMNLAFHQTHCVSYKVVCVRRLAPYEKLFQIHIYSSDTGRWKISVESFSAHPYYFDKGVYCNGAIHWYPHLQDHLYFKLEDEQLQALPLPVQVASSSRHYYDKELPTYVGESRGHLHLVTKYRSGKDLHLNVYELLSDFSGWFVKYQVEYDELLDAFPEMWNKREYCFDVIDVVRGEKEEETFMVVIIPGKIIRLHLNVYELLRDCSGWFVKYQVDLDAFPEMGSSPFHGFHVIDVVRGEKEEDTFMVLMIPGKLITYNVHDESFKLIYFQSHQLLLL